MTYDVVVVGAGHAGCEAALAAARVGTQVLLLTLNLDRIAHMPCNCSIGGPGKSHLVREIDALGGQMGVNIDRTLTHIRLLNTRKGPAVRSLRAQADKRAYEEAMKQTIESQKNVLVRQAEVAGIAADDNSACGVVTATGVGYRARAVVLAAGTFLRGQVYIGHSSFALGRAGEPAAIKLSESLAGLGLHLGRLKTGTVPRIHRRSIDVAECEVQPSDSSGLHFSLLTTRPRTEGLLPCLLTWTNGGTHDIVRDALPRSATYGGLIEGVGPRYCPSIEAKVVRFPDKERHQVFLEREGWRTDEVYVWGLSSSLPEDVQSEMLHSIAGLRRAEIMRPGYAIEYDYANPRQLTYSLESRQIPRLFLAGQINGTSGYEEAGVQGLIAGANAALALREAEPLVLGRHEAYAGVLIDDLVRLGVDEPYRMMTSRAEHRLSLRESNADLRLTPKARQVGLITDEHWAAFVRRSEAIKAELVRLSATKVAADAQLAAWAREIGATPPCESLSAERLLERPEVRYEDLIRLVGSAGVEQAEHAEVEASIKYRGYLAIEQERASRTRQMESVKLPSSLDYSAVRGIRAEARERLHAARPLTLGQAMRLPGVTPSDIAVLAVWAAAQGRAR